MSWRVADAAAALGGLDAVVGNAGISSPGPLATLDVADWDNSVATNSPGQSGNPQSPHYRDLFQLWAKHQYFPLFFSREKIDSVTENRYILEPAGATDR